MRIGVRLAIGFGLVLAMGLIAAVVATTGMRTVSQLGEALYRRTFTVSNQALKIQMDMVYLRNTMLRVALSEDAAGLRSRIAESEELAARIERGLGTLGDNFLGDHDRVQAAGKAMTGWTEVRQRITALSMAGRQTAAAHVAQTEGAAAFNHVNGHMDYVVATARDNASALFDQMLRRGAQFIVVAIAVFAGSLVLGGMVSLIVTNSITGPLSRVRGAMAALSGGDLTVAVPEKERADEIGAVARDLEVWKRNVAERLQAEEHLRLLSEAMAQSSNSVVVTDVAGGIIYVNRRFSQLTGYEPEEVVGKSPAVLKSPNTPAATHAKLWSAITRGEEWQGELEDVRKDGNPVWVLSTIAPIRDGDGRITHFVAIQQDITERKRFEVELQRAREAADIANRAKSELLANMSHELRTPLNAIIGFSSIIAEQVFGQNHAKYQEYGRDILASGEHLLALISDILDTSAVEAGKLSLRDETVAVAAVTEAAIRLVEGRAAEGGVALMADLDPAAATVIVDERRMKQILLNLLSNAVKFTGPGGTVRLSTAKRPNGGVAFAITDTGIGMDATGIATALTPFGQIDSAYARRNQGTGLGLPLVKGLVEAHGGELSIDSQPGIGTTVTFTLPPDRCDADGRRPPPAGRAPAPSPVATDAES